MVHGPDERRHALSPCQREGARKERNERRRFLAPTSPESSSSSSFSPNRYMFFVLAFWSVSLYSVGTWPPRAPMRDFPLVSEVEGVGSSGSRTSILGSPLLSSLTGVSRAPGVPLHALVVHPDPAQNDSLLLHGAPLLHQEAGHLDEPDLLLRPLEIELLVRVGVLQPEQRLLVQVRRSVLLLERGGHHAQRELAERHGGARNASSTLPRTERWTRPCSCWTTARTQYARCGPSRAQTSRRCSTRSPPRRRSPCRTFRNAIATSKSSKRNYTANELDSCPDYGGLVFRLPFDKGILNNWATEKLIWDHVFGPNALDVRFPSMNLV